MTPTDPGFYTISEPPTTLISSGLVRLGHNVLLMVPVNISVGSFGPLGATRTGGLLVRALPYTTFILQDQSS